jgi:hypothetical protein
MLLGVILRAEWIGYSSSINSIDLYFIIIRYFLKQENWLLFK